MKLIGIKKIWYGNVFSAAVTGNSLYAWLNDSTNTHEVKNSHEGTWGYTQDDPSVDDYINELTGKPYYRDQVADGNKTIKFTMGEFTLADKAALQGGTATDEKIWASGDPDLIYKGVVALTKTGNYIVFTNASIIAKADQQNKAIGLGVTAVACENETASVSDEYYVLGSEVVAPQQ